MQDENSKMQGMYVRVCLCVFLSMHRLVSAGKYSILYHPSLFLIRFLRH